MCYAVYPGGDGRRQPLNLQLNVVVQLLPPEAGPADGRTDLPDNEPNTFQPLFLLFLFVLPILSPTRQGYLGYEARSHQELHSLLSLHHSHSLINIVTTAS